VRKSFKVSGFQRFKVWLGANLATTAKRVKDGVGLHQKPEDVKKPKFSTRKHNRCNICGRPRAFLRKFGICRLCFRGLALRGEIPGVSKSSW
jgi:small subunit ribosomal protein S14